jgi:enoyl-CoA hydratase
MEKALEIAKSIASHPQRCLRNDRLSMLKTSYFPSEHKLMEQEFALGVNTLEEVGFRKQVKAFVTKSRI